MKDNLPWFKHDNNARNNPKMKALVSQFGAAGYGHFWMLNELISQATNARLDLTKRINRGAVAQDLGMPLPEFEAFLAWISDPEIDLVIFQDGFLMTEKTQKSYDQVEKARARKKNNYQGKTTPSRQNDFSPRRNDNSPRQNNTEREREREEEFSKSERSVGDIATGGEIPGAPLRRFSIESLKKKIQDCPIPLSLSPKDLEIVFANFEAADLRDEELEPYLAYAARRASRQSKSSKPNGYFRNVLVTSCDWILAFREEKPKPKPRSEPEGPSIPSPSGCECGSSEYAWNGGDVARCKACGATLEFDPELDAWAVTMAGEPVPENSSA